MKKLLSILFLAIGLFIAGCESEPDVPSCEAQGWGEVLVENDTGYSGYVDCTKSINGTNYEKFLSNGGSYRYEMDKGTVYIWFSFDGDEWVRDSYYLNSCEELTYRWYIGKKKSTEGFPILEIYSDGKLVQKTVEFEWVKRN